MLLRVQLYSHSSLTNHLLYIGRSVKYFCHILHDSCNQLKRTCCCTVLSPRLDLVDILSITRSTCKLRVPSWKSSSGILWWPPSRLLRLSSSLFHHPVRAMASHHGNASRNAVVIISSISTRGPWAMVPSPWQGFWPLRCPATTRRGWPSWSGKNTLGTSGTGTLMASWSYLHRRKKTWTDTYGSWNLHPGNASSLLSCMTFSRTSFWQEVVRPLFWHGQTELCRRLRHLRQSPSRLVKDISHVVQSSSAVPVCVMTFMVVRRVITPMVWNLDRFMILVALWYVVCQLTIAYSGLVVYTGMYVVGFYGFIGYGMCVWSDMYFVVSWCVMTTNNSLQLFFFNVYLRDFDWCSHHLLCTFWFYFVLKLIFQGRRYVQYFTCIFSWWP